MPLSRQGSIASTMVDTGGGGGGAGAGLGPRRRSFVGSPLAGSGPEPGTGSIATFAALDAGMGGHELRVDRNGRVVFTGARDGEESSAEEDDEFDGGFGSGELASPGAVPLESGGGSGELRGQGSISLDNASIVRPTESGRFLPGLRSPDSGPVSTNGSPTARRLTSLMSPGMAALSPGRRGTMAAAAVAANAAGCPVQVSFAKTTHLRPRVIPEGSRVRYAPDALMYATAVAFAEEASVVVFGGSDGAKPTNDTWVYGLATKMWRCYPNAAEHAVTDEQRAARQQRGLSGDAFPPARCGHSAVAMLDVVPPVGPLTGGSGAAAAAALRAGGSASLSASPAPSSSAFDASSAPSNGALWQYEPIMLIFGGANLHRGTYFNDLWSFDVQARAWREQRGVTGTPPSPRWQCAAAALESRLFIFGGESSTFQLLNDLHCYDHQLRQWRNIRVVEPCPSPRMMAACTTVADKMVLCGGSRPNGGTTPVADTWVLELRTLLWRRVGDHSRLSPFRSGGPGTATTPIESAALLGFDGHVILHGGKAGRELSRKTWCLSLATEQWTVACGDAESFGGGAHGGGSDAGSAGSAGGSGSGGSAHGPTPGPRWQHCGCVLRDVSVTRPVASALSLRQLQAERTHLTEEPEIRAYTTALAEKLAQQISFEGLLTTYRNRPVLVRTVGAFMFGGCGASRLFTDFWRVDVTDPTASQRFDAVSDRPTFLRPAAAATASAAALLAQIDATSPLPSPGAPGFTRGHGGGAVAGSAVVPVDTPATRDALIERMFFAKAPGAMSLPGGRGGAAGGAGGGGGGAGGGGNHRAGGRGGRT